MRQWPVADDAIGIDGHAQAIASEAVRLTELVQISGLDALVPPCPGWRVAELLRHLGYIHRWATGIVADGSGPQPPDHPPESEVLKQGPADEALLEWFREGAQGLVEALRRAPADLSCWSFLRAESPLAFWARRQCHETAIHRADVELALGGRPQFSPALAADGIDELLLGFAYRARHREHREPPGSLMLQAIDGDWSWHMMFGPGDLVTGRGPAETRALVRGTVSDLYLLLWNRGSGPVRLLGDPAALSWWQESFRIRW